METPEDLMFDGFVTKTTIEEGKRVTPPRICETTNSQTEMILVPLTIAEGFEESIVLLFGHRKDLTSEIDEKEFA